MSTWLTIFGVLFAVGLYWSLDQIKDILEEIRDTLHEIKGELEPADKYDHLDPRNYDEQIRESIRKEERKGKEEEEL